MAQKGLTQFAFSFSNGHNILIPQLKALPVIELRSATDNLKLLQEKMAEYRWLGVRLGLLINPKNEQIEVYRPGRDVEILASPSAIDCGEVMPGFVLSMSRIW